MMMRSKTLLLTCAAVLLSPAGWRGDSSSAMKAQAGEADLAGIERLHRQDIAATLSGDLDALAALWTKDAVRLQPGRLADIGKQAIHATDERSNARHPDGRILTYVPDIKDVRVTEGGWAFEWGYFSATYKETPTSEVKSFRANLLRVMQRQSDGSWRFARVMWNEGK
jgi:uncharacterized protein (TIGR02246 family)